MHLPSWYEDPYSAQAASGESHGFFLNGIPPKYLQSGVNTALESDTLCSGSNFSLSSFLSLSSYFTFLIFAFFLVPLSGLFVLRPSFPFSSSVAVVQIHCLCITFCICDCSPGNANAGNMLNQVDQMTHAMMPVSIFSHPCTFPEWPWWQR